MNFIRAAQKQKSTGENAAFQRSRPANWLGYAFALVCLLWVARSIDFSALAAGVASLDWKLVAAAIALDVLSYLAQGWRWSLLLHISVGQISVSAATRAIYAGLFVNEVLPLKLGEAVRGFLVARQLRSTVLKVLPTIVAERFFDAVWLAAGVAVIAFFVSLPPDLLKADEILGAAVVLAIGIFFLLAGGGKGGKKPVEIASDETAEAKKSASRLIKIKRISREFGGQMRSVATSRESFAAFALSLAPLVLQAAAFWLVMRAYHIEISLAAGLAVFLIVQLGSAIPAAPANVGSYQFFTVLGLTLFGVDRTSAAGFSIVVFIVLTVPLWLLGFLALSGSGMTVSAAREEIGKTALRA